MQNISDRHVKESNNELKIYVENDKIKQVFSRVYNPKTNGTVETFHKSARKYLVKE